MRREGLLSGAAVLAGLGLAWSTAAWVVSFVGPDPGRLLSHTWWLHAGVFVVLIPAVAVQSGRKAFGWRGAMGGGPRWLRLLVVLLLVNAVVGIGAFEYVCGEGGPSRESDGTYSISSHGRVLRRITAEEYGRVCRYEARSFIGWWMAGYGFALTLLVGEIGRKGAGGGVVGVAHTGRG